MKMRMTTRWFSLAAASASLILALAQKTSAVSATGGAITETNGYRIHTFTNSSAATSLVVTAGGNVDVLVVAGGGGGGNCIGGGGGAGGLIYTSSYAIISGSIPVTVGAGGAGGIAGADNGGFNGSNSTFGGLLAYGGGGGAGWSAIPAKKGGSGGGGQAGQSGALGTNGQGKAGGNGGPTLNYYPAGGGGGAGAPGGSPVANTAPSGNGGTGLQYSISGVATYYAGGGGGGSYASGPSGTGGVGGGGNGGIAGGNNPGFPGTNGTGGGGGAGAYFTSYTVGGNGGAGIVIVRYIADSPLISNTSALVTGSAVTLSGYLVTTGMAGNVSAAVFWGTNDAANSMAGWTYTNWFPGWSAVGSLSTNVTLSSPAGTRHYYRFFASNSMGYAWAQPSGSFSSTGAPGVNIAGGAVNVGPFSATLQGEVTGGYPTPEVWIYWGATNQGATKSWEHQIPVGPASNWTFSATPNGMSPDRTYYYTCYASNIYGDAWSAVTNFTSLGGAISAGTYYVAKHGTNTNPGTLAKPWGTIKWAVTNIAPPTTNDVICVGEGVYTDSVYIPATMLSTNLVVCGGYNTNGWTYDPVNHPSIITTGSGADGFWSANYSVGITIQSITITGCRYGINYGALCWFSPIRVTRCIVTNNAGVGISAGGYTDLLIANCLIARNASHGVFFGPDGGNPGYSTLDNCTVVSNGGAGLTSSSTSKQKIIRNSIIAYNVGAGIWANNAYYDLYASCLYGNRGGELVSPSGASSVRFYGGTLLGNPKFVNPAAGDWRLRADSACIGRGIYISVTNDLLGNVRAAPVDMGCYQSAWTQTSLYPTVYADINRLDDEGPGTNWATAFRSIGSGLAYTTNGGTCLVASGVYAETVVLDRPLTLQGVSNPPAVTIVYTNRFGAATISATANASLRNLALRAPDRWGIWFEGNTGGPWLNNVADNCQISGCSNGVWMNQVVWSGGIHCTLTRCAITGNYSGVFVDAMANSNARMALTNCLIANNTSNGIYETGDIALQLVHCTVAGNGGSGIYWTRTFSDMGYRSWLTNSIVAQNGVYGLASLGSPVNVGFSCVYDNGSTNIAALGGTPFVVGSGCITNQKPNFADAQYRLALPSPCIDTGTNLGVMVDLQGQVRPLVHFHPPPVSGFDMGAYEWYPPPGTLLFLR